MGRLCFDTINERAKASFPDILHEWIPGGKVSGNEFKAKNPTRVDNKAGSFSVNITTAKWGDFATGDSGGDPVSLYAYIRGLGQGDAAKELADRFSVEPTPQPRPAPAPKKPKWDPVVPVPATAPAPNFRHYKHGEPSATWEYKTAEGETIGHICRYELPDKKEIIPLVFASNGKRQEWKFLSFPKPRPLYGLDRLAANLDANVIIVEGEKCADALQAVIDAAGLPFVVISWPGGGKAVKHADWSPLAGRKIVLWPDNDEPGIAAAADIVKLLPADSQARTLRTPGDEQPKGWDCADAIADGWDAAACMAFIKTNLQAPVTDDQPPLPEEPPESNTEHHAEPTTEPTEDQWTLNNAPFQCLGYDHGGYFYLPRGTRQVVELTASGHNKQNLMALAKVQWWERLFPGKDGVSWNSAANAMLRKSEQCGVYDPDRIRGRGAWEDEGRSVLHMGDSLMVDGHAAEIEDIGSDYIYEAAAPLNQGADAPPLSTPEANKFAALCDLPCWESGIFGRLLAGWCVIAPICGALSWRPHIWCSGAAGSGKSWVMDNILRPAIGPAALCVQSNTTEAGLRQLLKYDARPVLFDEAEGEDRESQTRIQKVLELMRQASSETGAAIVKGTSGGRAQMFRIRSVFAFSSIGVGATQKADNSRLTILSLVRNESPDRAEQFDHLKKTQHDLLTPQYLKGLRARTIRLVPTIRKNADTFARAAAAHLGSQRAGDQMGALLAGAYSLYSAAEISAEDAIKWVQQQDWGEAVDSDELTDEARCLSVILESVIRVDTGRGFTEMSIGEAVSYERPLAGDAVQDLSKKISAALERNGIKHDGGQMIVSNTHSGVAKILQHTPWSKNWSRILTRMPGAEKTGTKWFAGSAAKGVGLLVDVE